MDRLLDDYNKKHINYDDFTTSYDSEEECKEKRTYYEHKNTMRTILPIISTVNEFKKIDYKKLENKKGEKKARFDNNIVTEKLNYDLYKYIYLDSIKSTFHYLFIKLGAGIFVEIKNNKLTKFVPMNNMEFRNTWHNDVKIPDKYVDVKDYFDKKNKEYGLWKGAYSLYDKSKWFASDCLIFTENYKEPSINSQYWTQLMDIIKETLKYKKVDDVIFFINKKDAPVIKNNRTEAFESIYGEDTKLDMNKYYYFVPILSQSTRDTFADIPIPTSDDWELITQKFFTDICKSGYYNKNLRETDWSKKKNTAVFRGSGTGCSLDIKENQRLHITWLNKKWKNNNKYNENNKIDGQPFLDAGIVRFSKRNKMNDKVLNYQEKEIMKYHDIELVNYMQLSEQKKYKYWLYIEGNSAAYRLGSMLTSNSLVLYVKSKYKLWLDPYIKEGIHFISIESDLSDLADKIEWCKKNDSKCKEIVKNANKLMDKILTREFIYEYMANIFNCIAQKQFKSQDIKEEYWKYKDNRKVITKKELDLTWDNIKKCNTSIIVPYRDNKVQDRKEQKDKFIKFWKNKKSFLDKKGCKFEIIIIEQSDDNRKFNRGYLLNVGAKISNYNNLVFHDVDLLPDDDLLPYYFHNSSDPIHIASNWEKYSFDAFFGGVTAVNKDVFREINGFPNNFWGWGGEDDVFYNRIVKKIKTIYKPNKGQLNEMKHELTSNYNSLTLSSILKKKLILEDKGIGLKEINYKKIREDKDDNIIMFLCELC